MYGGLALVLPTSASPSAVGKTHVLELQPAAVSISKDKYFLADDDLADDQVAVPHHSSCLKHKTNKYQFCCRCGVIHAKGSKCRIELPGIAWPATPSERVMIGRNFDLSCALEEEEVVQGEPRSSVSHPENPGPARDPPDTRLGGDEMEQDLRDGIARRRANEIAEEFYHDYRIPVVWNH